MISSLSRCSSRRIRSSVVSAAALALVFLLAPAPRAQAQISIQIGPAPICPYGYFPYPPYNCAPWGYYGPAWFNGGIFIGAGPWYHGPRYWHGPIDRDYDPRYGYRGPLPHRGDRDYWEHDHWRGHPHGEFRGHEMYDGHGRAWHGEHGHGHGERGDHGDHHDHGGHGDHGHPHDH